MMHSVRIALLIYSYLISSTKPYLSYLKLFHSTSNADLRIYLYYIGLDIMSAYLVLAIPQGYCSLVQECSRSMLDQSAASLGPGLKMC